MAEALGGGLCLDARRALVTLPTFVSADRTLLEAEVSWRLGEPERALSLLGSIEERDSPPDAKARRRLIEGSILAELGRFSDGERTLREGIELANSSFNRLLIGELEVRLLYVAEDRRLPGEVDRECDRVRDVVVKSGAVELFVSLNCIRGRVLAKRGVFGLAQRHFEIAADLLHGAPNPLLEGSWHLDLSVLSWQQGQLHKALEHAGRALTLATVSGHARTRAAAVGNIGLLRFYSGNAVGAETDLRDALTLAGQSSLRAPFLESLAQLRLHGGQLEACEALLLEADKHFSRDPGQVKSWYDLAAYPTRIALATRRNNMSAAMRLIAEATAAADARSDTFIGSQLLLLRTDALLTLSRHHEAGTTLAEALQRSPEMSLHTLGELERIHGTYLAGTDAPHTALEHYDRAIRIFLTTGHAASRFATISLRNALVERLPPEEPGRRKAAPPLLDSAWASRLVEMANHPELLGREAFAILEQSHGVAWVTLTAERGLDHEMLLSSGIPPQTRFSRQRRSIRVHVGNASDREIVLACEPLRTFEAEHVVWSIRRLLETAVSVESAKRAHDARTSLWPGLNDPTPHHELVQSEAMRDILHTARQLADTGIPILITGETGCGKEVLARAIHDMSRRGPQLFVPFNCTAVARDMLDSQLFGHRRGAFTGAADHFPGVIRTATGGTVFLDEIGEIGLDVQPKLLRFLESNEVHPLGEGVPQRVDVRVIAATNADLDQLVAEGRFRQDLFYRLTPARLHLPPLRERREEIPGLVKHFVQRFCTEYGKQDLRVPDEVFELMLLYRWPGNIRQLMNEVRRLVALTPSGSTVTLNGLSSDIRSERPQPPPKPRPSSSECVIRLDQPLEKATAQLETMLITSALADAGGIVEKAAQRLGISRKGLFLKRRRLKL